MGRYTTVQAFADNNPNMRAIDYAQATGMTASSASTSNSSTDPNNNNRGPVITEKVDNPYGSTAGAGSGEFHVYRHARAREMARWEHIHATEAERKAEQEFHSKVVQDAREEELKTEKRRKKRERAKDAKRRKKNMKLGGVGLEVNEVRGIDHDDNEEEEEEEKEEFEYTPIASVLNAPVATSADGNINHDTTISAFNTTKDQERDRITNDDDSMFANDGSFLERMKKEFAH